MARNRINYPVQALYVGPSPATGSHFGPTGNGLGEITNVVQLYRIQNCNYGWSVPLQDISQIGETAPIDRIQTSTPDVTLDFSYLLANMINESGLGFTVDGSTTCISGMLTQVSDEKNYFLKVMTEGVDANASVVNNANIITMGVGNGFLSSYAVQAAVGGLPTVNVTVSALNMAWTTGYSGQIPAVNPVNGVRSTKTFKLPFATGSAGSGALAISTLRPGDITVSFARAASEGGQSYDGPGVDINDIKIQSFNLSFDLNREAIEKLGSLYAYTRQPQFPVNATLSIDAVAGDLATGDLSTYLQCSKNYDIEIRMRQPTCTQVGTDRPVVVIYQAKSARLDSQNFSAAVGGNKTVTHNFTSQIAGLTQINQGIRMSGVLHQIQL